MKVVGAGAGTILLAGCLGDGGDGDGGDGSGEMVEMTVLETDGGINALVYFWGQEQGVFEEHNINISIEVAPFGRFERSVVADLTNLNSVSVPGFLSHYDSGEDIAAVARQTNFYNKIHVRNDSGVEELPDLADATLGVPLETSTTTNATRTIAVEDHDFDILEDPNEVVATDPPTVWSLLLDGEIDAGLVFEAASVRGATKDELSMLYDPAERWKEMTGDLPPLTLFHAYRDWIENNPGQTIRFLRAWEDAVNDFNDNIDAAVSQYGRLAAIETDDEQEVFKEWVQEGPWFPLDVAYPPEKADNDWDFIQSMADLGLVAAPEREEAVITTPDLEEIADMSL